MPDLVAMLNQYELFGAVYCASLGAGYRPPENLAPPLPRCYLVAGQQEPFFLGNAARWARTLHAAGADARMAQRDGSHGGPVLGRGLRAHDRRGIPAMSPAG